MSTKSFFLDDRLYDYLLSVSLRDDDIAARLREETARLPQSNMQIAPEQAQFLGLLAGLVGARRTLDVGVFTGYSALAVARALPDDGRVVALDVSEEWTAIARRYWREAGMDHRIHLRIAPALETLDTLIADDGRGTFDFAFIDADKENYMAYYERCLELMRPGGVIAVDNVLWSGSVANPADTDPDTEAIRAFNAELHQDERIDLSMVPIADGLTLAVKRFDRGRDHE